MAATDDDIELVIRAGCCMAVVDGRLSRGEIACIRDAVRSIGASPKQLIASKLVEVAKTVHRDGVEPTIACLCSQLQRRPQSAVQQAISQLCETMTRLDPHQENRLRHLRMALLPDGSEHPPNERDNDLSANLSLIMQIMSRTGSPSQLLTLLRRRLGASVWVRPWAVAAVVSVCFGLAVLTYMQQAAERHEFRQALFATAHRVALAWDYHSYPHDLAVECRLLKPAVRTKEEEGVLSLFLAAWDIQSCSAFLTGLEEESRLNASILQSMKEDQERRGFENALNDAKRLIGTPGEVISPYRAVVDLSSLPNYADFEEQSEMLRKGYVRVAAAETSEPGILEPLKDLPRLEGKFGKYVEYESAKDYLAKLLVATTHTIGILINNRGRLP